MYSSLTIYQLESGHWTQVLTPFTGNFIVPLEITEVIPAYYLKNSSYKNVHKVKGKKVEGTKWWKGFPLSLFALPAMVSLTKYNHWNNVSSLLIIKLVMLDNPLWVYFWSKNLKHLVDVYNKWWQISLTCTASSSPANHFLIFRSSIVHLWQDHKFQCLESLGRIPM